jgi:sulfatase modifying factor 1
MIPDRRCIRLACATGVVGALGCGSSPSTTSPQAPVPRGASSRSTRPAASPGAAALAGAPSAPSARATVEVPAGPFVRGCDATDPRCAANEQPSRTIQVSAFEIDVAHVTVAAYRRCVAAGACSGDALATWSDVGPSLPSAMCNFPRSDREDHPINCVDWHQAAAYCHWAGKRLPTEAEWEKARRGPDGPHVPWTTVVPPTCAHAMVGIDLTGIVDKTALSCTLATTRPAGTGPIGPYGTRDLPGNVWEWTADVYDAAGYAPGPDHDPTDIYGTASRSIRGIRWSPGSHPGMDEDDPGHHFDVFTRDGQYRTFRSYNLGFRCARTPGVAPSAPRRPMPVSDDERASNVAGPALDPATALAIGVLAGRCEASSAWVARDGKELVLCEVNLSKRSIAGVTYYFYTWPAGRFVEVDHVSSPLDLRRIRYRMNGFAPRPPGARRLPFERQPPSWD